MFVHFGFVDTYAQNRVAEFLREVENDRLIALATRPGPSVRLRLAAWLHAVAARIEGAPRASIVVAKA